MKFCFFSHGSSWAVLRFLRELDLCVILLVGLVRFELTSIAFSALLTCSRAPEATSLDQASRKPQLESLYPFSYGYSKPNQKAIVTRVKRLSGLSAKKGNPEPKLPAGKVFSLFSLPFAIFCTFTVTVSYSI